MYFRRIAAAFVILRLLLAQQRLERRRARDQFLRREIWFGDRQAGPHRSLVCESYRHLSFPHSAAIN
jgi:hypothetical protein